MLRHCSQIIGWLNDCSFTDIIDVVCFYSVLRSFLNHLLLFCFFYFFSRSLLRHFQASFSSILPFLLLCFLSSKVCQCLNDADEALRRGRSSGGHLQNHRDPPPFPVMCFYEKCGNILDCRRFSAMCPAGDVCKIRNIRLDIRRIPFFSLYEAIVALGWIQKDWLFISLLANRQYIRPMHQ